MIRITLAGAPATYGNARRRKMLAWLNCLFRGFHVPERQFVGGFRCAECGRAGADLAEMGFENFGYAPSLRRAMVRREVFRG